MRSIFRLPTYTVRLIAPLALVVPLGMAQMGGMRGGYGGTTSGSIGGMMGGALAGMMGGGSGLTIGPDGTLYITRSAPAPSQGPSSQAPTTQLAAIDASGNPKWTLPINSTSASQPVLSKDGTLFLTTSDWLNWMFDWTYTRSTPSSDTNATLLVVKPGTVSATIVATVPLTGQVASAPQVATDTAGNSVVYVIAVEGLAVHGLSGIGASGSYLYAFTSAGALKYRLQLSQGGFGMMGL